MSNLIRSRNSQVKFILVILMMLLIFRLFSLTIVEGQDWEQAATNISVKNIYTSAPRGEIKDRYGRVIAGNQPSFTVRLSNQDRSDEELNLIAERLISILESNGDSYVDNLPILIGADGSFQYTYHKEIRDWLASQGLNINYTAEQAFSEIKRLSGIDDGVDKYEAQTLLQTVYNIYPPISVKNMKYLKDLEKESFLQRHHLEETLDAGQAFAALREQFGIDPALTDLQARRIMVVRNELASQGYRSYLPADIAKGVSDKTIIVIEEESGDLPGVEVVAEAMRYYPERNTAAHILGYLGKISEQEKTYYNDLGYNNNDLVGQEGLEKAFESTLKGQDGVKKVEVNALGELVRTISEDPPQKGKDLYLTIDLELQKTAEEALEKALAAIRVGGTFESQFGNYNYSKTYSNANVGAVVALDVNSGEVLAMASYPDFDPNLFAAGISKEDWLSLQGKNMRDPLSPLPLFNVATRTAVQPGSIFKLVTATAALDSGLDPNRKLYDGGAVRIGNRTYGCAIWNSRRGSHGYVNLYEAIELSCNYYFFDIGSGYDYYKGGSLGLSDSVGIEKIMDFAQQYGLGKATGIEIPETVVPVPSEERKLEQTKAYLRNVLIGRADLYFTEETVADKKLLTKSIETIVAMADNGASMSRNQVEANMQGLGLKEEMIAAVTDLSKYTYFNQAKWTKGDELNISIGQGENAYTPLQMANYIATVANGGTLYPVTLIRGIEGELQKEQAAGTKLQVSNPETFDSLVEGMDRVVSGPRGTARGSLGNFPVTVGAKTGTAQRSGKINPPDEVEYIKTYLPRINSSLSFAQVEAEMSRLMKEYPEIYTSRNGAIRQAVINLSKGRVTAERIDAYKPNYDNFAWFVSFAPVENPKIAVAVLLFQGGSGGYPAPVAREIIGKYLELDQQYVNYQINTRMTE